MKEKDKVVKDDDELIEDNEIYTFKDSNGTLIDFYHIANVTVDGTWYAAFSPVEGNDEISTDEVVFFELKIHDDHDELVCVENQKTIDKVWDAFLELMVDDEEECDCEDHHHHKDTKKKTETTKKSTKKSTTKTTTKTTSKAKSTKK